MGYIGKPQSADPITVNTSNITDGSIQAVDISSSFREAISGSITESSSSFSTRVTATEASGALLDGDGSVTFGSVAINTTSTDAKFVFTATEDSSTAAPVIDLKRNSSSPADADYLGQIKFKGENDADQEVVYAKVTGKIQDASDGSEDGIIEFANKKAGSNVITARLRSDSLQLLNSTNLSVAGTTSLTGTLDVTGVSTFSDDVTVQGTLTAQEIHTEFTSASIVFTSGSTIFGNSSDDVHNMTGSLNVSGSFGVNDGNVHIVDKIIIGSGSGFDFGNTNHSFNVKSSGNNSGFSVLSSAGGELVRFIQESNDAGQMDFYDGGSLKIRLSSHANANNYINNGGNVGIGTNNPSKLLHLNATDASPELRISSGSAIAQMAFSSGNGYFLRLGDASNNEDVMIRSYGDTVFNGGGNVGIGTTNPTTKVDIASTSFGLPATSGTTPAGMFRIGYNDRSWGGNENMMGIINSGTNGYAFYMQTKVPTNYALHRPTFLNPQGGYVAINSLSGSSGGFAGGVPAQPLHVHGKGGDPVTSGTYTDSTVGSIRLSGNSGQYCVLDMGINDSNDYAWLQAYRANSLHVEDDIILNPNGGNVGVGVKGSGYPASTLHLGADPTVELRFEDTGQPAVMLQIISAEYTGTSPYNNNRFIALNSSNITFETGGSERMRILSDGRVAIKATSLPNDFGGERGHLCISSTDNAGANNYSVLQMQGHSLNSSGINGFIAFYDHTTENARIQSNRTDSAAYGDLRFATKAGGTLNEQMRIRASGNVWFQAGGSAFKTTTIGGVDRIGMVDMYDDAGYNPVLHVMSDRDDPDFSPLRLTGGRNNPSSASQCIWIDFHDGDGTHRGGIQNGSTPDNPEFFNGGSDERIKTNIVDTATNGLQIINGLELKDFTVQEWYNGYSTDVTCDFVAQNAEEHFPAMVSEHKMKPKREEFRQDFVDAGLEAVEVETALGTEEMFPVKCISHSALIPILVKALQEADDKIDALTARIEALES